MGLKLPGGFSPTNFVKQLASYTAPGSAYSYIRGGDPTPDFDVFSDISVRGGDRNPVNGAFIGPQRASGGGGGGGSSSGGGGGGGGGGGYYSDPYAQWGGQAAYNTLVQGFNNQKTNIFGTAQDAARNAGIGLRGSILDLVADLTKGQRNIDNRGINNELNRQQSTAGILGMVGRGIRSGGVQLANRNAGDSSASEALARAYGDIGRRELTSVGNEYALENREISQLQDDLNDQRVSGVRKIRDSKTQTINNIVAEARNSLAQLDAAMLDANLPERIAIEQEKSRIQQQAMGELAQYDSMLSKKTSAIKPKGMDARRAEAAKLAQEGRAPENAFDFTSEVPLEFLNTGPFASELPIFTYRQNRGEEDRIRLGA